MAVFDLSFTNKKTQSGSQQYGVLVDQLEIEEARLSSDGKLSPGDYALLAGKAQKLYAHPGLTPAQRSNIEVKVAQYQAGGRKDALKTANDANQLDRELEDDNRKISMTFGNDPAAFLEKQAALQNYKVQSLAESINNLDNAGDDSSSNVIAYNQAVSDYQDTLEALQVVKTHSPGAAPTSGFAAYITTNNRGEISDVKIAREGSANGYLETNGLYGGLKIYGKLNRKDGGKNVFLLGSKTFSAVDTMTLGPDGSLKASTLVDSAQQKGKPGSFTIAQGGYSEVDSSVMKTQTTIRSGSYAQGEKGFIYKANADGTYTKYVNADKEKLGISDNDIIKVPRAMENAILQKATATVDSAVEPAMPAPTSFTPPPAAAGISPAARASIGAIPAGPMDRIPTAPPAGPVSRAPQDAQGTAVVTTTKAKGFLQRLFGR